MDKVLDNWQMMEKRKNRVMDPNVFDKPISNCRFDLGEVPEWPKGTDCKSVGEAYGGSNPPLPTTNCSNCLNRSKGKRHKQLAQFIKRFSAGVAQLARASAFQAEGRGFESRLPLQNNNRLYRLNGSNGLDGKIGPRSSVGRAHPW